MICGCLRRYELFYLLCNFHLTILRFYCILTQNESQWMQGIVIQNDLTKGDLEYQTRGVKVHAGILCGCGETLQLACVLNWVTDIGIVPVCHVMEKQSHHLQSTIAGKKTKLVASWGLNVGPVFHFSQDKIVPIHLPFKGAFPGPSHSEICLFNSF